VKRKKKNKLKGYDAFLERTGDYIRIKETTLREATIREVRKSTDDPNLQEVLVHFWTKLWRGGGNFEKILLNGSSELSWERLIRRLDTVIRLRESLPAAD